MELPEVSEFSRVVGYRTNVQVSVHFFTLAKNSEKLKFNKINTLDNSDMYEILNTIQHGRTKLKNT